jgi:hypothetical protein
MILHRLVHARSGDKGNTSDITVVAYRDEDYPLLCGRLTQQVVADHFADIADGPVERYEVPQLRALKFVLHDALGGGVTSSLALDAHGKALSSCLLELDLAWPEDGSEEP